MGGTAGPSTSTADTVIGAGLRGSNEGNGSPNDGDAITAPPEDGPARTTPDAISQAKSTPCGRVYSRLCGVRRLRKWLALSRQAPKGTRWSGTWTEMQMSSVVYWIISQTEAAGLRLIWKPTCVRVGQRLLMLKLLYII